MSEPDVMDQPALTHRRILAIALPVVAANITVPILGLVDTAVIGQLGDPAAIGAVGLGAVALSNIFWIFGFLRMGTVGLAAQARGAGARDEEAALLARALLIGAVAGCLLILTAPLLIAATLAIAPASDAAEAMAEVYLAARFWGAPAAIATYGITGWLIAAERTRAVFVIQVATNLLNIILSVVFVLALEFGVAGVAWASVLAEWAGLVLALWLCRDGLAHRPAWARARLFARAQLWRMAQVNGDILIRSALLMAGMTAFLFLGSAYGDAPLAANQILLQFIYLIAYGLDGFAFAAESLVGQAMGARAPRLLHRSAVICGAYALALAVAMALAFALAGGAIIDFLTPAEDVRAEARAYLPFMVATPLIGVLAWMMDGIFIGATRTVDMRNMMILSFAIACALGAVLIPLLENLGVWITFLTLFGLRGVTLAIRYPALLRAAT